MLKTTLLNQKVTNFSELMLTLAQEKSAIKRIKGILASYVDNCRLDLYSVKSSIFRTRKSGMIESHKCSLCSKAVHSKAIITHCQHPMCFVCMRQRYKELRDIKCPLCSDDYNLGRHCLLQAGCSTTRCMIRLHWISVQ